MVWYTLINGWTHANSGWVSLNICTQLLYSLIILTVLYSLHKIHIQWFVKKKSKLFKKWKETEVFEKLHFADRAEWQYLYSHIWTDFLPLHMTSSSKISVFVSGLVHLEDQSSFPVWNQASHSYSLILTKHFLCLNNQMSIRFSQS